MQWTIGQEEKNQNSSDYKLVKKEALTGYADANRNPCPRIRASTINVLQQIFENITNLQALKVLYISTNPLISAFGFSQSLGPVFLLVSAVNKNYSQVDRWWSLLPLNIWWKVGCGWRDQEKSYVEAILRTKGSPFKVLDQ